MHQGWSFGRRSDDAETTPHAHASFPHLDISAGGICESSVADDSGDYSRLDQYLGAGHPRICRGVASQAEGVRAKEGRRELRKGPQLLGEGGSLEDRNQFGRTTREKPAPGLGGQGSSPQPHGDDFESQRLTRSKPRPSSQDPLHVPGARSSWRVCALPSGRQVRWLQVPCTVGMYLDPTDRARSPLIPGPGPHPQRGPHSGSPRYRQDRRGMVALGH